MVMCRQSKDWFSIITVDMPCHLLYHVFHEKDVKDMFLSFICVVQDLKRLGHVQQILSLQVLAIINQNFLQILMPGQFSMSNNQYLQPCAHVFFSHEKKILSFGTFVITELVSVFYIYLTFINFLRYVLISFQFNNSQLFRLVQ